MALVETCSPTDLSTVWKSLAFESNLIQGFGEKHFRRIDTFVKSRIPSRQGNAGEGLDPIEHIEYHFSGTDDAYTEIQSLAANTTQNYDVRTGGTCDPCEGETTSLTVNDVNNLMCDPPTSTLQSGYNIYRGLQKVRAVQTEPVCAFNLMRMKHLAPYTSGVRKSFPKEMNVSYCKSLESEVIDFGLSNTTTDANAQLKIGAGFIPGEPAGTADFGTFEQHAEYLRGSGWTGPIVYAIGHSSLQAMLKNHKTSCGYELNSSPFTSSDMRLNAVEGEMFQIGDITFKILTNPPRGYITQEGSGTYKFNRVDPRQLQAGNGAGITAEYDAQYQNAWITCGGRTYKMIELSYFIHPTAAYTQPFAMAQVPGVPVDTRFNMEVKVVRGAYLDCNVDDNKFVLRARHFYKFVPHDPRLMGCVAHCYAPYQRFHHAPVECDLTTEVLEVGSNELCPPLDNACCDVEGGSDPTAPRCVDPTAAEPNPTNGVGEIRAETVVLAVEGGTSVTICAERFGGCSGAASIQADTSNGTATAGVDYTAVVAEVLSWADGEQGLKCFNVTLVGTTAGGTFDVDWTAATGATTVSDFVTPTVVTIPDAT